MSAIRFQSSNPAFANAHPERGYAEGAYSVMTVQGAIGKTFGLLGILTFLAIWSWNAMANHEIQFAVLPGAAIGGTILAFITIFKPNWSPWTAPVYAAFEGVFLGMFSYFVEHLIAAKAGQGYPGIAIQAVSLTAATLFCMLFVYTTGIVRVTQKLKAGVIAATGAVALVYLVSIVMSLFGARVPFLNDASPIGIGISLVIVGIAAFNLLLDFDFIDQGANPAHPLPKYMEWYAAFGLMLTLVWLYLEFLRLLRKFQDRN